MLSVQVPIHCRNESRNRSGIGLPSYSNHEFMGKSTAGINNGSNEKK